MLLSGLADLEETRLSWRADSATPTSLPVAARAITC
jgi:hypothetical protein